jgi:uncharacterized protein YecT (DUF1311 family)
MKKTFIFPFLLLFGLSHAQTQGEMNNEALEAFNLADAEMTIIYKNLMASLSTQTEKDYLLAAQRSWITYKEAHCKAIAYQFDGGSMQPMIKYSCLETLTRERIQQLTSYNE